MAAEEELGSDVYEDEVDDGQEVFLTEPREGRPKTASGLYQDDLQRLEELRGQLLSFAEDQERRRQELEEYVTALMAEEDADGQPLVDVPANYNEIVDEMASEGIGAALLSKAGFQWEDEETDPEARQGLAVIRRLDERLLRAQRKVRELTREREDRERSERDDSSVTERSVQSERTAVSSASKRSRSLYGYTDPSDGFIKYNIEHVDDRDFRNATDEEDALVDQLMEMTENEENNMALAYTLNALEVDKLTRINQQLRDSAAQRGARSEPPQSAGNPRAAAAADDDYVRLQRENRERRDQMRGIERRLRELSTTDGPAVGEDMIRELLRGAIRERGAGGEPLELELLSADDVQAAMADPVQRPVSATAPMRPQSGPSGQQQVRAPSCSSGNGAAASSNGRTRPKSGTPTSGRASGVSSTTAARPTSRENGGAAPRPSSQPQQNGGSRPSSRADSESGRLPPIATTPRGSHIRY